MKFQKLFLLIILCLFSNVSWSGECLQGDCKNGPGTYLWDNGDKYVGEFSNGLPNGEGLITTADGDVYEGGFKNSKFHGNGKWSRANGDVYVGEFNDNDPHGSGIYKVSDGRTIEGTFTKGQLTAGILISQDGSATDVITGEPVERSTIANSNATDPKYDDPFFNHFYGAPNTSNNSRETQSSAGVTASVDQNNIELNESFTLEIKVDSLIDEEPDTSALEKDFIIGSRNWKNHLIRINGAISRGKTWFYTLTAKRAGDFIIPSVIVGSEKSQPLDISILPMTGFFYKDYEKGPSDYRYQIDGTIRPLVYYHAPQILIDNVVALKCPNIRKFDAHSPSRFSDEEFYNQGDLYMQFLFSNQSIYGKLQEECRSPRVCEFRETNVMHQFFINHNDYNKYTSQQGKFIEERGYVFDKSNLIKNPRNGLSNYYRSISSSTGINDVNKIRLTENFRSGVLDRETLILDILPVDRKIEVIPSKSEQERYQIRLLTARASSELEEAIVKTTNPKYTSAYDIKEVKSYQCELVKWTDMLKEKEAYLLKREHDFQEIINNRNNNKEQKIEKRTF